MPDQHDKSRNLPDPDIFTFDTVVGVLPDRMTFLPLSNEEIDLARTKSKEIQDKLSKYRFWSQGPGLTSVQRPKMPSPAGIFI